MGRETDVLMEYYIPPNEPTSEQRKSAFRWYMLSTLFVMIAAAAQIACFVMIFTNSKRFWSTFWLMIGTMILHKYCDWASKDALK